MRYAINVAAYLETEADFAHYNTFMKAWDGDEIPENFQTGIRCLVVYDTHLKEPVGVNEEGQILQCVDDTLQLRFTTPVGKHEGTIDELITKMSCTWAEVDIAWTMFTWQEEYGF